MNDEGEINAQKQLDGSDIPSDNYKNVSSEVQRVEIEQQELCQEARPPSTSSATSAVGTDSSPDCEIYPLGNIQPSDEYEKAKIPSNVALKNRIGENGNSGFRSMLFTAALTGPPSGSGGLSSRPTSADSVGSEKNDKFHRQNTMPQILSFKRESEAESRPSTATSTSTVEPSEMKVPSEDPTDEVSCFRLQGLGAPQLVYEGEIERALISHNGGEPVEVISQCCQTEWSYLQDMKLIQYKINGKPDWSERRAVSRQSEKSSEGSAQMKIRRKKKSVTSASMPVRRTSHAQEARKASIQHESERGSPRLRSKSKASTRQKSSVSGVSSLPQTPKGDQDIFFRAPTVEPSSGSSSDSEYEHHIQQESDLLPSIGPPTILQYIKESENPPLGDHEQMLDGLPSSESLETSLFGGPCMFCSEEILPFPTVQEVETLPPEQLYCCRKYERFVKAELTHRGNDAAYVRDEMIDIKPHAPYGTKAARKAAKERAAERAREREMERQKAAGVNPTNFYALTRQMKTITYSLASTKCMDEGWTVRPTTPSQMGDQDMQDPFVIEINPQLLRRQTFLERFYDDGKRFLLFLPDGSGCCYYPSGNVAVIISLTEQGKFTYLVYEDNDEFDRKHTGMLAVFEPSGYGTCYFKDGSVRMVLNPFSGVLLDNRGARKKKWLWNNLKTHVHAPPFQPITFSMTRHLSIRCLAQNKIVLTFNHHRYTARFNVGAKLKALVKVNPPTVRDHYETHLAEMKQFVNILIDRSQTAIRFPHHPRPDKLPLPLRLQKSKESSKKRARNLLPLSRPDTSTVIVN